jgi:hypothetical protein
MAAVFDELQQEKKRLEAEVGRAAAEGAGGVDPEAEVGAALSLARRLTELAADEENLAAVGEVFRQVNVRLFLRFRALQVGKRQLNRLTSGVVTFGSAAPPIPLYEGPTGRAHVKGPATPEVAGPGDSGSPVVPEPCGPGREGDSLGNVSRGDWIRTSDLLNPIQECPSRKMPEILPAARFVQFYGFHEWRQCP